MTKQKRDRLFKGGRPVFRSISIYEDGHYSKDIGIIWAAYKRAGGFYWMPEGMTEKEFADRISQIAEYEDVLVCEDKSKEYKSGSGIIAVGSIRSLNGWKFEPHVQFMPWATTRNKLRSMVSFHQWVRYRSDIGVCLVYSLQDSKALFDKVCDYGVLRYVGKIPGGDERGDNYVYSARGKK